MKQRLVRLDTIERALAQRDARRRANIRGILSVLADRNPDLALVEPCDTDPDTYRDIQINQALVREDWDVYERLREEERAEERRANPPPDRPLTLIECIDKTLAATSMEKVREGMARTANAIAAAKKRLAQARKTAKPRAAVAFGECEL